jgi:hypothetical protein
LAGPELRHLVRGDLHGADLRAVGVRVVGKAVNRPLRTAVIVGVLVVGVLGFGHALAGAVGELGVLGPGRAALPDETNRTRVVSPGMRRMALYLQFVAG